MKKVRISKEYGVWYYNKIVENDMEFAIYEFWNEEGTEGYTVCMFKQINECIKQGSKEAREEYIKLFG